MCLRVRVSSALSAPAILAASCFAGALLVSGAVMGALSSCSTGPAPGAGAAAGAEPAVVRPELVDCACCFTMVECMRSGLWQGNRNVESLQCEVCCDVWTFATDPDGRVVASSKRRPEPVPVQFCAPMPPR